MNIPRRIGNKPVNFYRFTQRNGEILATLNNKTVNIKEIWHDLPKISSPEFELAIRKSINIGAFDQREHGETMVRMLMAYNISKKADILDIGAFNNMFIDPLHENGFINSQGIDTDIAITFFPSGRQMNFRDLPINEKFDVLHFANLLDYMGYGSLNNSETPSMELFASKINAHMKKGGLLFYQEHDTSESSHFRSILRDYGYKDMKSKEYIFKVWKKP